METEIHGMRPTSHFVNSTPPFAHSSLWGLCATRETKHTITFVSAFFTLQKTPYFNQTHPELWDPESLMDIVSLGVPFCLYIGKDCKYESLFREWETAYPNFRIMSYRADYHDTWIHAKCIEMLENGIPVNLPEKRNREKDTYEYLVYMNSRVELLEDAISENVWNTQHYAWVDFHVSRLLKHKEDTLGFLKKISSTAISPKILTLPGCWPKPENMNTIATDIHWRFSGSFLLGDAESIQEFAELYRMHFATFLETYRSIPWEVNFWAYLEHTHNWKPTWYRGDHDDSLFAISADAYTSSLAHRIQSRITYAYPEHSGFHAGSISYVYHNGRHLINTRYVSYWMYPSGYYRFYNSDRTIENMNFVSELDAETMLPNYYCKMGNLYDVAGSVLEQPYTNKRLVSVGLEDIRLYSSGDTLRFIATTYNYAKNERSRMITGDYLADTMEYRNCVVIQPPSETTCEKNWVPLPKWNEETGVWDEWFVYKWHPMELGRIHNGTLRIEKRFATSSSVFSKIRGSTTFHDYGDGAHLVGLVHFSEEHTPRHYYHMLVLLDRETFEPRRYSEIFYFETLAIEFCIGLKCDLSTHQYSFWISRFDRDPILLRVPMADIPINNDIHLRG
jgi:hypothetical protein